MVLQCHCIWWPAFFGAYIPMHVWAQNCSVPFAVQALAKYAFGLGTVTMVLTTLVFTGMSLPPGQGLGTQIMVKVISIFTQLYH